MLSVFLSPAITRIVREPTESPFNTDVFRHRYKYRRRGLMVRLHNVVAARLFLGYRPVWQVAGLNEERLPLLLLPALSGPQHQQLDNYCLHCPIVADMLPRGWPLVTICRHLLANDNLDEIPARSANDAATLGCLSFLAILSCTGKQFLHYLPFVLFVGFAAVDVYIICPWLTLLAQ